MKIRCVWEHNGNDSILYADSFIGAFTRGTSKDLAIQKMPSEIKSYLMWKGDLVTDSFEPEIVQEKCSDLTISDADSDVLFDEERKELSVSEYEELKALVLKSARDFLSLYEAIPGKNKSCLPVRVTFYGQVPRTAFEMYEHTKMLMITISAKLVLSQIMRETLWNAGNADLRFWKASQTF